MLPEWSNGSDGTPENDAGLRHRGSDDVGVVAFFRDALMEEVAVRAPRFQGRLHEWRRDRQVEEAQRKFDRFQFPCHEAPVDRQSFCALPGTSQLLAGPADP